MKPADLCDVGILLIGVNDRCCQLHLTPLHTYVAYARRVVDGNLAHPVPPSACPLLDAPRDPDRVADANIGPHKDLYVLRPRYACILSFLRRPELRTSRLSPLRLRDIELRKPDHGLEDTTATPVVHCCQAKLPTRQLTRHRHRGLFVDHARNPRHDFDDSAGKVVKKEGVCIG